MERRRAHIWHGLGQSMKPGMSVSDWQVAAGLKWAAVKAPAFVMRGDEYAPVGNRHFIIRSDNGHVLSPGTVTNIYQIVQPREWLDFCEQYISADERFQLDTAMSLKTGELIVVTAKFTDDVTVAGDKHKAHLLASTTFDGSGASLFRICMERVVCRNTFQAAIMDLEKSIIRVRHNTKFDKEQVAKQLATLVETENGRRDGPCAS